MNRFLTAVLMFAATVPALAVYEIGDAVEDLCWQDLQEKKVCLSDHKGTVQVLLYNSGWCPPCNEELSDISPQVVKYDGKAVTFLSLSADGWTKGSGPSTKFLKEWKAKHSIPFTVAASPKDAGRKFFEPPIYIPNVAIIGTDGRLAYKEVSPGVEAIFEEVDRLLKK